jgi:hypothetical protein
VDWRKGGLWARGRGGLPGYLESPWAHVGRAQVGWRAICGVSVGVSGGRGEARAPHFEAGRSRSICGEVARWGRGPTGRAIRERRSGFRPP